jgi:hypothetical protein
MPRCYYYAVVFSSLSMALAHIIICMSVNVQIVPRLYYTARDVFLWSPDASGIATEIAPDALDKKWRGVLGSSEM